MPAIRGAQLIGILDGFVRVPAMTVENILDDKMKSIIVNLAYEKWLQQDQQLLSYINNSLLKDVLAQVAT